MHEIPAVHLTEPFWQVFRDMWGTVFPLWGNHNDESVCGDLNYSFVESENVKQECIKSSLKEKRRNSISKSNCLLDSVMVWTGFNNV